MQHLYIILLLSLSFSNVTDIDGNVYETVSIGDQDWMAENLKVAHYNNGDVISTGQSNADWSNLSAGAYAVYNDDQTNAETYGNLYNWYAVVDEREICPAGWHIPDSLEWEQLINHLGGSNIAGGKLKEEGTVHWNDPNIGGTNESGFNGLPSGARIPDGNYSYMGGQGYFWSSIENNSNNAWRWNLTKSESTIYSGALNKKNGFSIRCVIDTIKTSTILIPEHFSTIQKGIDASSVGDTVLVAEGTYIENINFIGKDIVVTSKNGPESTIIYGNSIEENIEVRVVTFDTGESAKAVLSGFTITNGDGGIWCSNGSSPVISGNIITGNTSANGGGIFISDGDEESNSINSPLIINNMIIENGTLQNDVNSTWTGRGGGVYCGHNSEAIFKNNLIADNNSEFRAGAFECWICSATLTNNTIVNNMSNGTQEGGIYMHYPLNVELINAIIWGNSPEPQIDIYCAWGGNYVLIDYSNLQQGDNGVVLTGDKCELIIGENNIYTDPLFINPSNDNYSLKEISPCLNTGTAFYELDGDTLINLSSDEYIGNAPDMGAFEYGMNLDLYNPVLHTQSFSLHQNYPNPFNPTTTIRYDLQEISDLTLIVYDINGREVEELYNGNQVPGNYNIIWDATPYPSGIYFIKMMADNYVNTQKLMLIK